MEKEVTIVIELKTSERQLESRLHELCDKLPQRIPFIIGSFKRGQDPEKIDLGYKASAKISIKE